MNRKIYYLIGAAAIVALCVFALGMGGEFGGSDDKGGDTVEDLSPGYEPWLNGIFGGWELPGETESLLFTLQAAIGALIIGYCLGRYVSCSKNRQDKG